MSSRCIVVGEVSEDLSREIASRFVDRCYIPIPIRFADWLEPLASKRVLEVAGSVARASRELLARDWVIEGLGPLERFRSLIDIYESSISITVPGPLTLASMIEYRGSKLVENPHRASAVIPLARSIVEACSRARVSRIVVWEKAACSLCSEAGARQGYSWWFVAEALSYVLEPQPASCIYLGPCLNHLAYRAALEAGARCIAVKGVRALRSLIDELGGYVDSDLEILLDPRPLQGAESLRLGIGARVGICIETSSTEEVLRELARLDRLKSFVISLS
ncbi:MAG: hypothetical protein GXO32_02650 [Crenarchaeota archaeon]|nr:hypothetical protein [Thermoproteota archaeon]